MSSEPMSTTPEVDGATERGLLIAMLVMVLLGVTAMLSMA